MIELTESESKEEIVQCIEAIICIRNVDIIKKCTTLCNIDKNNNIRSIFSSAITFRNKMLAYYRKSKCIN